MRYYRTSEWVSTGHPDKVADYISEFILDRMLEQDPNTRYALEVQIKSDKVSIAGEVTTTAKIVYADMARAAVNEIGYTKHYQKKFGQENTISGDDLRVSVLVRQQSPDIAQGVDKSGWGDQGIFFGFYCDETKSGQGLEYQLAKEIGTALYETALVDKYLGIDIKTQVTISANDETDEPPVVEEVIVAIPMVKGFEKEGKKEVKDIVHTFHGCKDANIIINGTGSYTIHGPIGDSGTTGRKLVVDFYGGRSRIGGGSPWTKDGTKADLTLNLFAHEMAKRYFEELKDAGAPVHHTETELSCCIGRQEVLMQVVGYDKSNIAIYQSADIKKVKTDSLIKRYGLRDPIYTRLCRKGLFSIFETATKEKHQ